MPSVQERESIPCDKPLTQRQQDIYDFIVDFMVTIGVAPTNREIGERFGIKSPNGVQENLIALVRKGKLQRIGSGLSRGVVPVAPEGCCAACQRPLDRPEDAPEPSSPS